MLRDLLHAARLMALLTLLTGLAYPLAVTGLARLLFPAQAAGSLVERDGRTVGSALIGQAFVQDRYFHSRPSAAGAGYAADNSGGSNLGPTSAALRAAVAERAAAAGGSREHPVPIDLATASASGLDPHLSPAAALYQVPRVAAARGLDPAQLRRLVEAHVQGPTFGLLGRPRVNVLALNLALDAQVRP